MLCLYLISRAIIFLSELFPGTSFFLVIYDSVHSTVHTKNNEDIHIFISAVGQALHRCWATVRFERLWVWVLRKVMKPVTMHNKGCYHFCSYPQEPCGYSHFSITSISWLLMFFFFFLEKPWISWFNHAERFLTDFSFFIVSQSSQLWSFLRTFPHADEYAWISPCPNLSVIDHIHGTGISYVCDI